jgi:hypothetical protein
MVKMIRDNTGRFAERPFYRERDVDDECERLIRELLIKRHRKGDELVETNDLIVLIEIHDAELDPPRLASGGLLDHVALASVRQA